MSYMNPLLEKNFEAGAAIAQNTIVKFDSADEKVINATAATDAIVGVVDIANTEAGNSVAAGDPVDVIMQGIAQVKLGGTVTRGQFVTAGANGLGVAAAPAAGTNNVVAGQALESGVAGDVIPVLVNVHQLQG